MFYYSYDQFRDDMKILAPQCAAWAPDTIVSIARGGATLGHALSVALDLRNLQSIRIESYDGERQRGNVIIKGVCDFSESKKVLIVDDIVDSGKTLDALLDILRHQYPNIEYKTASIFTKEAACIQPDFSLHEATDWISFYWEVDFLPEA